MIPPFYTATTNADFMRLCYRNIIPVIVIIMLLLFYCLYYNILTLSVKNLIRLECFPKTKENKKQSGGIQSRKVK